MEQEYKRMSIDDLLKNAKPEDKVEVYGRPNHLIVKKTLEKEFYIVCLFSEKNMVLIGGDDSNRDLLNDLELIECGIQKNYNIIVQGVYEKNKDAPYLKVKHVCLSIKTKDK